MADAAASGGGGGAGSGAGAGAGGGAASDEFRVVVVGDAGTGKSSLINSFRAESFTAALPRTLKPLSIGADPTRSQGALTLVDTNSSDRADTVAQLLAASAVVLVCSFDQSDSLESARDRWFHLFEEMDLHAPVVVAVNKSDLLGQPVSTDSPAYRALLADRKADAYVECSARSLENVEACFAAAQRAARAPLRPLYDAATRSLRPRLVMALNRIFRLFDRDNDLFLSERELGNFMKAAFGAPLPAHQMAALRAALRQQSAKCLRNGRLSFDGFCLLLRGVIETRMVEQVWTMLERFGYTRALTLRENYVPFLAAVRARAFDQTCELREEGVRFLTSVFHKFDQDQDGALSSATPPRDAPRHPSLVGRSELDEALLPCPESPLPLIYPQIVPVNKQGMVTLDGWLSLWSMLLCVNAPFAVLSLVHVGLPPESVESAVVINASKRDEEGLKRIERRCVFGLVMGLRGSGKSALMGALVERPFRKPFQGAFADGLTVAARLEGGAVLVLRELPDSKELVDRALEPEGEAARADIVLLVYDGSSKGSFDYVNALIPRLPDHIPALLVHAKADLSQFFPADSVFGRQRAGGSGAVDYALSYEIATEPVSAAADSPSDLRGFFRTVHANALRPDAFRPLSPARVKRQRTWWLVRALGVAAVAAASGVVSYVYVTQVRRAGAAEAAALGQDASAASGAANAAAAAGAAAATPTGGGGLFGRLRLRRA